MSTTAKFALGMMGQLRPKPATGSFQKKITLPRIGGGVLLTIGLDNDDG
jgi:hypothetical protein